jgi:DNA mismatch repair protein MutS
VAQAGCPMPAMSTTLAPYDALYTCILGADSLWAGLSSFAVEMSELRYVLAADGGSLVISDEVAAGTESVSGSAFAAATLTRR